MPAGEVAWAPALDIYEKDDRFIVRMELPGVSKEDLDISVSENVLTIKGERKPPAEVEEDEYQCCEVCYGSFSRSITLPGAVDASKIEATYDSGMLQVSLPKVSESKPVKVEIKAK